MYFTACKPVDRNTECDALCGNGEEEGEGGRKRDRGASAETNERRNVLEGNQVSACECVPVCERKREREREREVALVYLIYSECNEYIDKSTVC